MAFRANNFTISVILLMGFDLVMLWVRQRRNPDNIWPVLFWTLIIFFTLVRPEETFNFYVLLVGFAMALMMRFEFMNPFFTRVVRFIEFLVYGYVLVRGLHICLGNY